eukprot:scaffold29396_cov18-Tisochrysis_lutea.AAC.1
MLQAQVAEAQRDLAGEVDKVVSEARATKTQEVEAAARAVEVSHIVRAAASCPPGFCPLASQSVMYSQWCLLNQLCAGCHNHRHPHHHLPP